MNHAQILHDKLKQAIQPFNSALIALSGGIDSSLVAYVSHQVLGDKAIAVTSASSSLKRQDLELTRTLTRSWGMSHHIITTDELAKAEYQRNPVDRCYHCKSTLYQALQQLGHDLESQVILNGTNCDDQQDYRPGLRAADEYAVRSPLLEYGFSKADVRELARYLGLQNADKPAAACLSSRVPYGTEINADLLRTIEAAERHMEQLGFSTCRVRHHGTVARIEVPRTQLTLALMHAESIQQRLRQLGYHYITLDLAGFRSGSLNENLIATTAES